MADDTQSRGKDFIIKHMNADHQRSLSLYLQVYCSVSSRASQPPKLEDIRLTDLVISAQGTRYTIPFHPPLNSLAETRGRVVAMHKECLQRLGLSDIVIKEYRGPRGVQLAVFTCCLAAYVVYARRANFLPGSLFYEMAGLRRFPGVAGLNYQYAPRIWWTLAVAHSFEALGLLAGMRLRKHGVPLFSGLWWAWVLSGVIEGFTAWNRFDQLVKEKKREGIL
ncbi:hypothetical protein P175DRAFT_0499801 [Aspergillus ochraceoroseus IBT 24754]|uniref:DUF2470 domain-containing protein n=1 Tax=Aspergillus ochraceoroseus IBT 24754 TaxID=1392256 RepID=A0A2T5M413_9EURO|nr:uncharacterized protein P175DRAFT_0499801 [Aspergillus ochraceoroseus IBT 24754]PTU23264.1 hypothetical protein P175DRAFT_0499801 [Aspergillus ochraceoroseus IBT 24754]